MVDSPLHSASSDHAVSFHCRKENSSPIDIVAPNFATNRPTLAELTHQSILRI